MELEKVYPKDSVSFNDLETFLKDEDLIDSNLVWVAGFEDVKDNNHPVTKNLFYGNKRLQILSVKDKVIYHLGNTKKGLKVKAVYKPEDIANIKFRKKILYPRVELIKANQIFKLAVTKNKSKASAFKHLH